MSDKFVAWYFVILICLGFCMGCTKYGQKISYHGETCDKCQQELWKQCTPFNNKGRYKCKCYRCGKTYKYYLGKQVKPKAIEANPKGIQTPLRDGFDR